jgi:hypothetical protein
VTGITGGCEGKTEDNAGYLVDLVGIEPSIDF